MPRKPQTKSPVKKNLPLVAVTFTTDRIWVTDYDKDGEPKTTIPVVSEQLANCLKGLSYHPGTELLPPEVLFWKSTPSGPAIGVWLPPVRRTIAWRAGAQRVLSLSLPPLGFVFVGVGRQYHIYAALARPASPKDSLYVAPLPNVHPKGGICAGNVPFPICSATTIYKAVDLFFASEFNAHLSDNRIEPDCLLLTYLKGIQKRRAFPTTDLVFYKTVGALMADDYC